MVKNRHGLLSHGTLKSAVYQELLDKLSLFFFYADTNSGKFKVTLIVVEWAWSNMSMAF